MAFFFTNLFFAWNIYRIILFLKLSFWQFIYAFLIHINLSSEKTSEHKLLILVTIITIT